MKNNQYSDLLLDQSNDLIWVVDYNLFLVYANKAYLNLIKEVTGVEKDLNTPVLVEGFGEGFVEKWKSYYQRALSGEYLDIEEDFYNPKTKEIQYGHISVFPLRDENGEIQTVACRSTDITLVIKQKNHASRLMDASMDVFCTIDEAGKFVFVSAVSADHWGYYPEELIGKPYRDLILEEDLEKSDLLAGEIMSGREFKSFPNRFRKKNGDVAYNLWSARWDNKTKLMYCVARDSKDKIEEEHRLRLLERVLNSTSDAILITDAQPLGEPGPKIIYVNEAFKKMSGYTAEEVIGRNPRLLQGPDSNYEELKELGEKMRRWEPSEITVLNYTKTGVPFWVHFVVSPVADEKGWFTHWISVQRDVTELKKQEAEKELLIQINLSFKEEELISAANRLCENLYAFGKFDLIELWCPNMEQTQLKLIGHRTQNQDFYEFDPSETSFQKSEGLPGQVWEKGKEIIWDVTEINKYFINEKAASRLGLQVLRGMPLTFNDELVGVLLIGTRKNSDYLNQFSTVLSRLEKSIGSEINRKKLENELRNVFDAVPEIICITDFDGRFLKINNAGCVLLGHTKDEVLFHSLDEFTLKEDRGKFQQIIKDMIKEPSVFAFENRFLSKDGQIIWLNWNCNPALEVGLVYASAKNITAEVQLRELNNQAGSLSKIGFWKLNLETNAVFWSEIVHQLHETNPDSFFPHLESAIDFYREDFRPLVMKSLDECITTGVGFEYEAVIVTKKLKERWVRAMGKVETVNGIAKRMIGSIQDITDRKESELNLRKYADELLISNKGLEQFSYIISHNLRAPVANILGLAQILDHSDPEMHDILVNDLVTNANRLDEVIRDLNSILKAKSVLSELREKVSLKALLGAIQQSVQNVIEQESLSIDLSGIQVDEFYSLKSYMHSIFMNLVTNTIKYRRTDIVSRVEVTSREETGKLIITYKDNGRGIDMTKNGVNVFGLYKRFHPDIEGKGMGLYLVKTQTEILGGKVSVESEVDRGVKFTFELPYRNFPHDA